jgi:hypothetical protein
MMPKRTQALPHTQAAKVLLSSRLAALAVGSLLPPSAGAAAGEEAEAHAASVLACLAAGPCGGRLSAMLCAALGLQWADSNAVAVATAAPAGAAGAGSSVEAVVPSPQQGRGRGRRSVAPGGNSSAAASADAGGADEDGVACTACRGAHGGDKLLLCDGCDAALHMDCLQPALQGIPEGDWLCPGCCAGVRQSDMHREAALHYLRLLLLSDSGRALLLRSGALKQAVPLLQQRAGAKAATAAAAAAADWGRQAASVLEALQAELLYARAAVHLLSQGLEEEPLALARGGFFACCCSCITRNRITMRSLTASNSVPQSLPQQGTISTITKPSHYVPWTKTTALHCNQANTLPCWPLPTWPADTCRFLADQHRLVGVSCTPSYQG